MRARPADLSTEDVVAAVAAGWALSPGPAAYVPEGGGSHHWRIGSPERGRFFVRVDDLDDKPWLGTGRESAFDALRRALTTSVALRREAGLEFVAAPLPSTDDEPVRRIGHRFAVSVYPFLVGEAHAFGPYVDASLRACVGDMLEALHSAARGVRHLAPLHEPAVAWRPQLDAFLEDPTRPWSGGPYSRAAHDLLAPAAPLLGEVVLGFDLLVGATAAQRARTTVTHGEPHPGNVMRTGGGIVLLDWDTVALAPPERDLWFVIGDGASTSLRPPRPGVHDALLALYRLRWYLDDVASAVHLFGGPHRRTADTQRWWDGLGARVAAVPAWLDALS